MEHSFWQHKTVLVTGHTGFKGSWLSLWLQQLGAKVVGFSLSIPTQPSLFEIARVSENMTSIFGDIRDLKAVKNLLQTYQPDIIFHLAAQPLVRYSYQHPIETYMTNIMGVVYLLEAIRDTPSVKTLVNVTSDKCYQNQEWNWSYRENEPLGGNDPYSNSKACAELVTASYRSAFFTAQNDVAIATARAGNVIGGGDWAQDRLMTDVIDAIFTQQPIHLRNPDAMRPWQHVLDPLAGYLMLAQNLWEQGDKFAEAWNFGPQETKTVAWMVEHFLAFFDNPPVWTVEQSALHEAQFLKLDSSKANMRLKWQPKLDTLTALKWVAEWIQAYQNKNINMKDFTLKQIIQFQKNKL
ncbi:MAG: CDP-glucose 4,6-dehydratase [Thiotrichaceae bacterium]|nr:CDP-glucose 4,6-dehydratase [Thiotrichaceae bacterium]